MGWLNVALERKNYTVNFNPSSVYVRLIAGGVTVLLVIGYILYLRSQVHHYKKLYDEDQITVSLLNEKIKGMTTAQNTQTNKTEDNVVKVVKGPETVKTVVKTIREAPEPADCKTPPLPMEVLNAW